MVLYGPQWTNTYWEEPGEGMVHPSTITGEDPGSADTPLQGMLFSPYVGSELPEDPTPGHAERRRKLIEDKVTTKVTDRDTAIAVGAMNVEKGMLPSSTRATKGTMRNPDPRFTEAVHDTMFNLEIPTHQLAKGKPFIAIEGAPSRAAGAAALLPKDTMKAEVPRMAEALLKILAKDPGNREAKKYLKRWDTTEAELAEWSYAALHGKTTAGDTHDPMPEDINIIQLGTEVTQKARSVDEQKGWDLSRVSLTPDERAAREAKLEAIPEKIGLRKGAALLGHELGHHLDPGQGDREGRQDIKVGGRNPISEGIADAGADTSVRLKGVHAESSQLEPSNPQRRDVIQGIAENDPIDELRGESTGFGYGTAALSDDKFTRHSLWGTKTQEAAYAAARIAQSRSPDPDVLQQMSPENWQAGDEAGFGGFVGDLHRADPAVRRGLHALGYENIVKKNLSDPAYRRDQMQLPGMETPVGVPPSSAVRLGSQQWKMTGFPSEEDVEEFGGEAQSPPKPISTTKQKRPKSGLQTDDDGRMFFRL